MHFNLSEVQEKEIMPGYHGKMIHSDHITIAYWKADKGAKVPEHSHLNEQIMQVLEGSFEFTVNGVTGIYGPNEVVVIPPYAKHSGKALTTCKLMDVFSPAREEYK
ncbi:cupin domain-containing protein [Eudoraea chungangensis]|uniref:cupin domain-containing protein n=1 Tax=Eudoraea chungangensis TaxID=1481905 RepID=UPI0023EB9E54|nr:cupin domain-containing protein [Eudoraea chungangensis]